MKLITAQASDIGYINEDTIIAWAQQDEPDNAQPDGSGGWGPPVPPQTVINNYNTFKQNDPSRPVFLNLGQGVAWPCWYGRGVDTCRTDVYYDYAQGGDILSFDVYPVNSTDAEISGKLYYVAIGVDNLRQYTNYSKPVWTFIETTNYNGVAGHTPTPAQVKAEVWMAIIHGAKGIAYFCHIFAPTFDEAGLLHDNTMRPAVTAINQQITSLAPVLNVGTPASGVSVSSSNGNVPIDIMARQYNGSTYIFSVAMRNGSTTGTFTVPSGSSVEVIGEGRTIPITNGKFSDNFGGYGVHLYKIN
jgi:hypothetical protein